MARRTTLLALALGLIAFPLSGCGSEADNPDEGDDTGTGGVTSDDDSDTGGSSNSGTGGAGSNSGGSGQSGSLTGTLMINELMPSNQTAYQDVDGAFPDWLELYNAGDTDISLEGMYVSDASDDPTKAQLGAGLSVPAGGVLVLFADGDVAQGANHLPFKLTAAAESVVVSDADGSVIDSVDYANAVGDSSFARFPDGTGAFAWCAHSTPNELNGDACP